MTDSQIVHVSVHGHTLDAVQNGERVFVVLKRACEELGIDVENQRKKLKDRSWATTVIITAVAEDGKTRQMDGLDLDALPMWLATISTSKVRPELREKLEVFQCEAAKVLRNHFFGRREHAQEIAQLAACVASLAEQVARQGEVLQRILTEPQAPADVIGTAGARHISEQIKAYATQMAKGTADPKKAYRSWLKSGANELAGRLGYFGTGKSWRNLSFQDFAKARPILEDMRRRAERIAPTGQTHLKLASNN